jgi:aspartyl-tRNA(Asn)/glutamyl-tRNA(Gln) amidotransferase subunit C
MANQVLYYYEMANITRDDVLKLARLARIDLSDKEIDEFAGEFSKILAYVEQLQTIDVTGLEPTSQVTGLTNVMRPDEIRDYGYQPKDLLKNVPRVQDDQIKANRMVG